MRAALEGGTLPYIFPYEDIFVWGISLLIFVLLGIRFVVGRRARRMTQDRDVDGDR